MLTLLSIGAISLFVSSGCLITSIAAQSCQNGGTFDAVSYVCQCTPQAYGESCEHRFADLNPCRNATGAGVVTIGDTASAHAARQLEACGTASSRPCINFAVISSGWYRFISPSGNYLVADYPCVAGVAIGCGSAGGDTPFTLRHLVFDGEPENGSKLYTARAYPFLASSPQCYEDGLLYYVRILECPDKRPLYYMGPTMSQRHRYCIGIYESTTTAPAQTTPTVAQTTPTVAQTTPTVTQTTQTVAQTTQTVAQTTPTVAQSIPTAAQSIPTAAQSTTTAAQSIPTAAQSTTTAAQSTTTAAQSTTTVAQSTPTESFTQHPSVQTPTKETSTSAPNSPAPSTTGPTTGASTAGPTAGRPEWNYLVNDESPLFRINATGMPNRTALSCQIRSNSLQVDYRHLSQAISDSTGLFCDFRPVVQWLADSKRIYINCLLEVLTNTVQKVSSFDITVCQSRFHGKPVRHLANRGHCMVEEDVDNFRPSFWRQWFGDL